MLSIIVIVSTFILVFGYLIYGKYLSKIHNLNNENITPSHAKKDGIDYVPTRRLVLFGHHFSSIAGAGPIVGPIIAGIAFGWMPAVLWIIIGSIFIGGMHDLSSIVASIRHQGKSISELAKRYINNRVYKLFLWFTWLTLIYVLVVFLDLTSLTFSNDGGVASSGSFYIFIAIIFGISLYRYKLDLKYGVIIFVPLVFAGIYLGTLFPLPKFSTNFWNSTLLIYCFIASVLPVWLLLQPRDFLSSFLLFASLAGGLIGVILLHPSVKYPAFTGFYNPKLGYLFPAMFIIIACGAVSGFHSLVSSGTSSKQLNNEKDALPIAYGSMLTEAVLALIALSAVMIFSKGSVQLKGHPVAVFAAGLGKLLSVFGISEKYGTHFGLLAVSTFLLTTLDTCSRLSRYILEEIFNMKSKYKRFISTVASLIAPAILVFIKLKDANGNPIPAWKAIWPCFGATNQLLAGLVLLIIVIWLKKSNKNYMFAFIPMVFMLITTIIAIIQLILINKLSIVGILSIILFILTIWLVIESAISLSVSKVPVNN